MNEVFSSIMTSGPVLGLGGIITAAALIVGYFPLLQYLPFIGKYVPAARVVAAVFALSLAFLFGFRMSDERESMEKLRATLAAREADIAIASKSRADAERRASEIEAAANAQMQTDADYIASLVPADACAFDPGPIGVRPRAGNAGDARARAAAGSR